jgi:hypothetical protein
MRPPVSSSKRRLVSASSGAAPEKHTLIELKSILPARTSGWLIIALYSAGTPLNEVGRTLLMVCSRSFRSRGSGTSAIAAWFLRATLWMPMLASEWNSGRGASTTSSHGVAPELSQVAIWVPVMV